MKIKFVAKVDEVVENRIVSVLGALHQISPDKHGVHVEVVPGFVVTDGEGIGWGHFGINGRGKPVIHIPGECPPPISQEEWIEDMLLTTLSHEWAHYEQYRDGKKIQERGVGVRTTNLAKQVSKLIESDKY